MSDSQVINRLVAAAVRSRLRPLGFLQKGRTRLWYDDRDWWLIIVEFQPGRNPGTYLNVGVMWLWVEHDYWAFDEGSRLYWRDDGSFVSKPRLGERGWNQHVDFLNADQFSRDIALAADVAARRVAKLRTQFPNAGTVAERLTSRETRPDESPLWHAYHGGAAAALSGDVAAAEQSLTRVVSADLIADWERDLASRASELFGLAVIDVPPDADLYLVRQLLDTGQRDGWWDYDELCVTDTWKAATSP